MKIKVKTLKINQYIIQTRDFDYLQSYNSIIAKRNNCTGQIALDKNTWDASVTTGKYRNIFLNEKANCTRQKIKSGEYILMDLNNEVNNVDFI